MGLLVLFVSCLVCSAVAGSSGVQHVHLVDRLHGNYLFRSGSPEQSGVFSMSALEAALRVAAPNVLPARFQMTLINVENLDTSWISFSSPDAANVLSEHAYFARNTSAGDFLFWHTVGVGVSPSESVFGQQLAWLSAAYSTWDSDKLVWRVQALRDMLSKNYSLPRVIVFHCDCGCDRTGELAGAYAMTFLNKTWDYVSNWNWQVAGRPQICKNHWAMQWYCVYLQLQLGMKSVGNCLTKHLCTPSP